MSKTLNELYEESAREFLEFFSTLPESKLVHEPSGKISIEVPRDYQFSGFQNHLRDLIGKLHPKRTEVTIWSYDNGREIGVEWKE